MSHALSPDDLAEQLKEARVAYYQSASPLMSDEEFDELEDQLRRIDSSHAYFSSFGIPVDEMDQAGKIRHRVPMLSMAKAKKSSDMEKWLHRLESHSFNALCIQPKIDGLSASLSYHNGRLDYVSTRGDGKTGQDISHVAEFIEDIPDEISFTTESVEIRGELYLPKNTRLETGGRPLRNNCVGLINRKEDREDLKFVHFLAYQILWPASNTGESTATAAPNHIKDVRFYSENKKIEILKDAGFSIFQSWLISSELPKDQIISDLVKKTDRIYQDYMEHLRDSWNYETDGLIILLDDNRLHDAIDSEWVVDHHHHYALALKPPSPSASTRLIQVIWQVSRQGNLTPVAQFDPVRMGGAVLERASLHNAENVQKLKLSMGDHIVVERANDVIPYVRANPEGSERSDDFIDKRLWPQSCPSCGSIPVEAGVNIICPNTECRMRVLQSILYWVRAAEIDQVALKTLEALYDKGQIKDISDLYTLRKEDFEGIEGFAEKKITNFLRQVERSKSMSATEFIARLGIPMVQKKSLQRLDIRSIGDFMSFDDESYVIGQRIVEWKKDPANMDFIHRLLEVIILKDEEKNSESQGVICLSGKAPMPRKIVIQKLEDLGWRVSSSVNRDTVKVICDDPGSQSSKLKKARKDNIPIVTYEEFLSEEGILPS